MVGVGENRIPGCFGASKLTGCNHNINSARWKDHRINVGNKCLTDLSALACLKNRALNQPSIPDSVSLSREM